jgi:cold-inducible RNA-binding protein
VGGLAWATNDQSLREAFSQFGEIASANVITDRETGNSIWSYPV